MKGEETIEMFFAMLLVIALNFAVSQCGGDYKNTLQKSDTFQYYDSLVYYRYDSLKK
jgi:hypothetical protein